MTYFKQDFINKFIFLVFRSPTTFVLLMRIWTNLWIYAEFLPNSRKPSLWKWSILIPQRRILPLQYLTIFWYAVDIQIMKSLTSLSISGIGKAFFHSQLSFPGWWYLVKFIYSEKATKILRNLPLTFDYSTYGQKLGEDFAKFCGLLRIYEL